MAPGNQPALPPKPTASAWNQETIRNVLRIDAATFSRLQTEAKRLLQERGILEAAFTTKANKDILTSCVAILTQQEPDIFSGIRRGYPNPAHFLAERGQLACRSIFLGLTASARAMKKSMKRGASYSGNALDDTSAEETGSESVQQSSRPTTPFSPRKRVRRVLPARKALPTAQQKSNTLKLPVSRLEECKIVINEVRQSALHMVDWYNISEIAREGQSIRSVDDIDFDKFITRIEMYGFRTIMHDICWPTQVSDLDQPTFRLRETPDKERFQSDWKCAIGSMSRLPGDDIVFNFFNRKAEPTRGVTYGPMHMPYLLPSISEDDSDIDITGNTLNQQVRTLLSLQERSEEVPEDPNVLESIEEGQSKDTDMPLASPQPESSEPHSPQPETEIIEIRDDASTASDIDMETNEPLPTSSAVTTSHVPAGHNHESDARLVARLAAEAQELPEAEEDASLAAEAQELPEAEEDARLVTSLATEGQELSEPEEDTESDSTYFLVVQDQDGKRRFTLDEARVQWANTHERMTFPDKAPQPLTSEEAVRARINVGGSKIDQLSHQGHIQRDQHSGHVDDNTRAEIELNTLADSAPIEQFSPKVWEHACAFFGFDNRVYRPECGIRIRGLNYPLLAYQFYAVFWMLVQCSYVPHFGCFCCDATGFGKTLEALAVLVIRRHLSLAFDEVEQDRRNGGGVHLPVEQPEGAVCPNTSCNKWYFPCPCENKSVTQRFLDIHFGPHLCIVPPSVMNNWAKELWEKHLDTNDTYLDIRVIWAYGKKKNSEIENGPLKSLYQYSTDQIVQEASTPNGQDAAVSASRFIFLSTARSVRTHLLSKQRKGFGFDWATVVIDEFHLTKEVDTDAMKTLRGLDGPPFYIFLSGTPWETNFADLVAPLQCIQRAWCNDDGEFEQTLKVRDKRLHWKKAQDAGKTFGAWSSSMEKENETGNEKRTKPPFAEFQKHLKVSQDILKRFMIRRTPATEWFGRPAVKICPHEHMDITVPVKPAFKAALQDYRAVRMDALIKDLQSRQSKWRSKVNKNIQDVRNAPKSISESEFKYSSRLIRTCNVFPLLAQYLLNRVHNHDLTPQELQQLQSCDAGLSASMIKDGEKHWMNTKGVVKRLVESSSRYDKVKKIWATMQKTGGDQLGRPEKLVLFTFSPFISAVLSHYISFIEKRAIQHIYAKDLNVRQDKINSFNDDPLASEPPVWLLGTIKLMAVGFSCCRAFRLILMEPDWLRRDERQAIGRVNRAAVIQPNLMTFSYRFVDPECSTESVLLRRQDARGFIEAAAYGHDDAKARLKEIEDNFAQEVQQAEAQAKARAAISNVPIAV